MTDGVICLIKSVYIESFGGIKDKEIIFNDGVNVIYGGNEAGKTTVCAFIKAMLYGMDAGRKSDIRTVARKRYMPADGKCMSGSMDISHYRISRVFGKTAKEDVISITDLNSGEKVSGDISEELPYVGEKAFSDLLFMESYSTKTTVGGEVADRLAESVGDSGSYETALKILDSERKRISGKKGVDTYEREISELKNDLCGVQKSYSEYLQNRALLKEKKRKYSQLCDRKKYLGELAKKFEVLKKYNELLELSKECEELKNCIADEERAEKEETMPTPYEFSVKAKKNGNIVRSGVLAAVMLAVAAALAATLFGVLCKAFYFAAVSAAAAAALILTVAAVYGNEKSRSAVRVKDLLKSYGVRSAEEYERVYNEKKERRKKELLELNRKFAVKASRVDDLKKELDKAVPDEDLKEFYNEIDIKNEYISITERIAEIQRDILVLESKTEYEPQSGEKLQRQIEIKERQLNKMYRDLECIKLVTDTVNEAVREHQSGFMPKLADEVSEIFSRITKGRYGRVFLSKSFDLSVGGKKLILDSAYLSNAAFDAVYLSLRLAIWKKIFSGKESFLIMDDAFIQYDDERAQAAMEYLKSCNAQIIYFTCQKRFNKNIDLRKNL